MPFAARFRAEPFEPAEIDAIIKDLTHYRYSDMEVAAFLISSASFMTSRELLALVHAMAVAGTQLKWPSPIVVDKHCIGGIPGNRTSMIVVPIVAAHGLTIPRRPRARSPRRPGPPTPWRCWPGSTSPSTR
jgi:thymidine phosphorylase